MKIIVTGSLGHISKPLTEGLVQKGHEVTVISSKPEKQTDIEALGATAAIGSVEDVDFLAATFTGADAVYIMVPPTDYFNPDLDLKAYCSSIAGNYAQATPPHRIKTISEYHRFMGLPKPEHQLVSVINFESIKQLPYKESISLVFDFYSISMKKDFNAKMKYGQQAYDFDEGIMFFISPGQVFGVEIEKGVAIRHSGWMLLIHPECLMEYIPGKNNEAI